MRKLLLTLLFALPFTAFAAGLTLPQGGLGTTSVPTNYVLIGQDSLRVTAIATSSLGFPIITFGTTSISALFPLNWNPITAVLTFLGLTTSTNPTIGQLPFWTSANTFGSVATGTITCTGTTSCGAGSFVVGNNLTITGTSQAVSTIGTTTGLTVGQGAYFTSITPTILGGFATGTVSAGTGISLDNATRSVIGGALQITNSGVTSLTATSPLSRDTATGAVTISCPTCTTGGITALGSGWATTTGTTITHSTSTLTFNGLTFGQTITVPNASALLFTPTVTGVLSEGGGGTNQSTYTTGDLLYASNTNTLSKRAIGTPGFVLASLNGIPTWTSTSSISNGVTSITVPQGVFTGALTFATSTSLTNGITSALSIVGSGSTLTFTPSQSGTRTVAGGGTGVATFASSELLYGNGTNPLSSVATSSIGVTSPITFSGTSGAQVGGTAGTFGCVTCVTVSTATSTITGTVGQVVYMQGTNSPIGTSTILIATSRNVGIASTTPWGRLSVDTSILATGVPEFAIGSSTRTDVVVNQAGNVGIGTSNPSNLLTVSGSDSSVIPGSFAALRLINTDTTVNNTTAIKFATVDSNAAINNTGIFGMVNTSHTAGSISADMVFLTANLNSLTERMRITGGGNVGVGTSTPWGLLSVNANALPAGVPQFVVGSSTATNLMVTNAGAVLIGTTSVFSANGSANLNVQSPTAGDIASFSDGTRKFGIFENSSLGVGLIANSNNDLFLGSNGTVRLVVKNTGNYDFNGGGSNPGSTITISTPPAAGVGATFVCLSTLNVINSGATCAASTAKIKTNITTLDTIASTSLEKVMALNPVSFNYKKGYYGGSADQGFLAEQVSAIDPILAYHLMGTTSQTLADGEKVNPGDPFALNITAILSLITKGVQEIEGQVQGILSRLSGDEAKIKDLQAQIDAINAKLK